MTAVKKAYCSSEVERFRCVRTLCAVLPRNRAASQLTLTRSIIMGEDFAFINIPRTVIWQLLSLQKIKVIDFLKIFRSILNVF